MHRLSAEFEVTAGLLELQVAVRADAHWTCLFGASGSGKTTILRTIAGFLRPAHGKVSLGDAVWCDTARRVWVPAHARAVRSAMQQAWLFPGTVWSNVRYGVPPERASAVDEVLERFRLTRLRDVDVRRLSGGERQRVSVARAIAAALFGREMRLLLLDEPFAGMDLALRDQFAIELRDWLRKRDMMVLSVTHDVGEAFLLDAEIVRVANGKIVEQGPVEMVLAEERESLRAVLGQDR